MAGEEDEELGEGYLQFGAYGGVKKMKTVGSAGDGGGGGGVPAVCCQVDSCGADLAPAKRYHRRHKVCEVHAKAPVVVVAGLPQRFCQQCSRFHEVLEFDEARRSCRSRLAGHNERRRKSAQMDEGVGSMHQGSSITQLWHGETIAPVHSQAKQFQIR